MLTMLRILGYLQETEHNIRVVETDCPSRAHLHRRRAASLGPRTLQAHAPAVVARRALPQGAHTAPPCGRRRRHHRQHQLGLAPLGVVAPRVAAPAPEDDRLHTEEPNE